jgi:hypothetical protein
MVTRKNSPAAGAEQRLMELGITLPSPPEPFGTYAEAVQTGNLLFQSVRTRRNRLLRDEISCARTD